jgi:hypothetical protein
MVKHHLNQHHKTKLKKQLHKYPPLAAHLPPAFPTPSKRGSIMNAYNKPIEGAHACIILAMIITLFIGLMIGSLSGKTTCNITRNSNLDFPAI